MRGLCKDALHVRGIRKIALHRNSRAASLRNRVDNVIGAFTARGVVHCHRRHLRRQALCNVS